MMKMAVIVFVVLVFIGLGFSGTMNAAVSGYQKVEQNPTIQHLQNTASSTIKNEVISQVHNLENTASSALTSRT